MQSLEVKNAGPRAEFPVHFINELLCEPDYDGLRLAIDYFEDGWLLKRPILRELTETNPIMESLMHDSYHTIKAARYKKLRDRGRNLEEGRHIDKPCLFRVDGRCHQKLLKCMNNVDYEKALDLWDKIVCDGYHSFEQPMHVVETEHEADGVANNVAYAHLHSTLRVRSMVEAQRSYVRA